MRYLILIAILLTSGCGIFSSAYAPAIIQVIDKVADLALKQSGKELDELPMACEHEYHPDTGQILVLCTVETRK